MKKRVLFMVINMNVGGTEKALLNMISEMPRDEYDITILMLEKYGGFLTSIPSWVDVQYLKGYKEIKQQIEKPVYRLTIENLKQGKPIKAFQLLFIHLITKLYGERSAFYKYILKDVPSIPYPYDLAIAYAGPMDFISYFVLNKINAKKKIQWIHFDITKIGFNPKFAYKVYKRFDKIFVVSNKGKENLLTATPKLKDKTEVFANIVSSKLILGQANEGKGFSDNFDGVRILTVGRLSIEKGQDIAMKVLSRLIHEGYKVKWYCLGDGHLRDKYHELMVTHKLIKHFIFLGSDPNPYPYMKQCDIYVQPSRHEGYCITLAEARCLSKPILTTNFAGAKEQIEDGKTGLVVSIDENEIYNALKKLLNNAELCQKFSNNLSLSNTDTRVEMSKIYDLIL